MVCYCFTSFNKERWIFVSVWVSLHKTTVRGEMVMREHRLKDPHPSLKQVAHRWLMTLTISNRVCLQATFFNIMLPCSQQFISADFPFFSRYMMLILKEKEIYLIDRDNNVFAAPQFHFPQRKSPGEHVFDTLLDGVSPSCLFKKLYWAVQTMNYALAQTGLEAGWWQNCWRIVIDLIHLDVLLHKSRLCSYTQGINLPLN